VHNDFAAPRAIRRLLPRARVVVWLHNEVPVHRPAELTVPDLVVAVSDYIRERAIAGGVPSGKVRTILNGVNLTIFHPDGPVRREIPRVLCAGRLDPNKGFHVALAALEQARTRGARFETTLAGARWWYGTGEPSPYEIELRNSLENVGGEYVGLVPRDRVGELFRKHDIAFALSISQDPCPLVVLEAMASGCALIASPRGGIPQVAGEAALLVDPDDPTAVADVTMRLLNDPEELAQWQQRALAHAATASWRTRAEAFVNLVEALEAA
jgi:glycosyltransferase involved in cell wall biosynthesis